MTCILQAAAELKLGTLRFDSAWQALTQEEEECLDGIQSHQIQNVCVDQEDFEAYALATAVGVRRTWGFKGQLLALLPQLNEAVAA